MVSWNIFFAAIIGSGVLGGIIVALVQHKLYLRFTKEAELLVKKRSIYQELVQALRVFVDAGDTEKEHFLKTYPSLYLWADDSIVEKVNHFINLNEQVAGGVNVPSEELNSSYAQCIIAMRKDIGFEDTKLKESDYRFFSFKKDNKMK